MNKKNSSYFKFFLLLCIALLGFFSRQDARAGALTIEKVREAQKVLEGAALKTPLLRSDVEYGAAGLYLKAENLQKTGSFKLRGAYYKTSLLSDEEKKKGLTTCSTGNHAQGLAFSANLFGIEAKVFVPSLAPKYKIDMIKSRGANVVIVDGVFDDAKEAVLKFAEKSGAIYIPPYDDIDIIAGQGTIGLEILEQLPSADIIVVPIGGGGLISGIAFAVKTLKPSCKIYGVQADGAAAMKNSRAAKKIEPLQTLDTIADGIAVKSPGVLTFELCEKYVDEIVSVSDEEIKAAIFELLMRNKTLAEGAGAASYAAVMSGKIPLKDKKVVCVISGGNIEPTSLRKILEEFSVSK